ncbi:MAG TPA: Uma2 family endonuclease [Gemmataceae bacterium]|nr:Uma2 family endonuclease [Gemmataceae bacterium]
MSIATRQLGLADHGKPVRVSEFDSADFEEGYKYELIDGRLYVSPQAQEPENRLELWLFDKLRDFAADYPDVINHVSNKARVIVPGSRRRTTPEPDLAAYAGYPLEEPLGRIQWEDVSPILVAEVLYAADPHKDLVRNVGLYLRVPSIREYWVLDARDFPNQPRLIVHRRRGKKWLTREYLYGETYETKLLPGFRLRIDPHH